jgi:hypothetical protein
MFGFVEFQWLGPMRRGKARQELPQPGHSCRHNLPPAAKFAAIGSASRSFLSIVMIERRHG